MERKIKEYDLVGSESYEEFVKMVNESIEDGYQPYGSPFVTNEGHGNNSPFFYQVMVKY